MSSKKSKKVSTLGSRITSLISVTIVLFLLGMAALVGVAGHNIGREVRSNLGFVIIMERDCSADDVNMIKRALMANAAVDNFVHTSADDILACESEYLGEDIASLAEGNPYAGEFDVKVRPVYAHTDSIEALTSAFAQYEGVDEITSESALIEGVDKATRRIATILLALAALMLVMSIALINNSVSLSIYGRRFIIHTMKLVGATAGFIRAPFIKAGLIDGAIAGTAAAALLAIINHYLPLLINLPQPAIGWTEAAIVGTGVIIAGAALCSLTAMAAVGRYLRADYDEMFLK